MAILISVENPPLSALCDTVEEAAAFVRQLAALTGNVRVREAKPRAATNGKRAAGERHCRKCGETGHNSRGCPSAKS